MNILHLTGRALRLWWQHWVAILFLNIVWSLLLLPVVTAPAATAMFFAMVRRIVRDEAWDWQDVWAAVRDNLWSAWLWGLPNLIVGLVLAGNFFAYRDYSGAPWPLLRTIWAVVALIWLLLNLYYWPFWLAQGRTAGVRTAYANSGRFLLAHGLPALAVGVPALVLLALSVRFVLPLVLGVTGLVVLLATLSVERALDLAATPGA